MAEMEPPSIAGDTDGSRTLLAAARGQLSCEAMANLERWLTEPAYADARPEIEALIMQGAWDLLDESFYTVLPFGTGGRRGPRGVGPNRINPRTIAESARGLVEWASHRAPERHSAVIAYDTRHGSQELSRVCAEVIAGAGMQALVFRGFRPTPQLSFTVRLMEAAAGIVVSASHNPPADNGFKAYGPDGGQIVPPFDAEVLEAVDRASERDIPRIPYEEAVRSGAVKVLGEAEDLAYVEAVLRTSRCSHRDARIVYTPLHGTGSVSVTRVLRSAGFTDLHIVEEQAEPNGDFPNVKGNIPNPEEPAALAEAAELAKQLGADVAIGTDPDGDRLGCVALRRGSPERWATLTGNQIGALLCHHVLSSMRASNILRPEHLVLTTAVTSPMIGKLTRRLGAGVIEDLLVGFKYMACVMESISEPERVVFACEESHGYVSGTYTRDKDAACAALLLCEAAAGLRSRRADLWDQLEEIYAAVGYHCDLMHAHLSPGKSGMEHIARMLAGLRAQPPTMLAGLQVARITDRLNRTVLCTETGVVSPLAPISDPETHSPIAALAPATDNLLIIELHGDSTLAGARAAVRPSGTEAKCKFYAAGWAAPGQMSGGSVEQVDATTARLRDELLAYALEAAEAT